MEDSNKEYQFSDNTFMNKLLEHFDHDFHSVFHYFYFNIFLSTIEMHAMRVNNADQDIGRLTSRIDLLQARFQKLTEEAAVMKIELAQFTEKLAVAEVLVVKLESEYGRWSAQVRRSADVLCDWTVLPTFV